MFIVIIQKVVGKLDQIDTINKLITILVDLEKKAYEVGDLPMKIEDYEKFLTMEVIVTLHDRIVVKIEAKEAEEGGEEGEVTDGTRK
jgi:hypothetical protein